MKVYTVERRRVFEWSKTYHMLIEYKTFTSIDKAKKHKIKLDNMEQDSKSKYIVEIKTQVLEGEQVSNSIYTVEYGNCVSVNKSDTVCSLQGYKNFLDIKDAQEYKDSIKPNSNGDKLITKITKYVSDKPVIKEMNKWEQMLTKVSINEAQRQVREK